MIFSAKREKALEAAQTLRKLDSTAGTLTKNLALIRLRKNFLNHLQTLLHKQVKNCLSSVSLKLMQLGLIIKFFFEKLMLRLLGYYKKLFMNSLENQTIYDKKNQKAMV